MKLLLPFLTLICFVNFSQSKKYLKLLTSETPEKILKFKDEDNFQFELDICMIKSIHDNDNILLDNCLKLGANANYKCEDCYKRDALMISLFYRNYYAFNKLKVNYIDNHTTDELGYNLLFAAAGCDNKILNEVINTYHPEFIKSVDGSSAIDFCHEDNGDIILDNIKTISEIFSDNIDQQTFQFRDEDDYSLLMFAVDENNMDAVKFIVSKGADPFHISTNIITDSEYNVIGSGSAFFKSMSISDRSIYDYFTSIGSELDQYSGWFIPLNDDEDAPDGVYTSLGFFLASNTNESFVMELEEKFDISYNGYEGMGYNTPMMFAIYDNNIMMVKRILKDWDGMFYKLVQKYANDKTVNPEIKVLIDNFVKENIK